jgi:hypothetical protein
MLVFGLFTHMACGATYALVPFVDRKALGGVAGIIGAGGNVGAVLAGFLMKGTGNVQQTLPSSAALVIVSALCAMACASASTPPPKRPQSPHRSLRRKQHENHRHRPRHGGPQIPRKPGRSGAAPAKSRCCARSRGRPTTACTCPNSSPVNRRTTCRWCRRASSNATTCC